MWYLIKIFQCVYLTLSIFTVVLQVLLLLYFSSKKSQSLIYISVGDVTCVFACNAYWGEIPSFIISPICFFSFLVMLLLFCFTMQKKNHNISLMSAVQYMMKSFIIQCSCFIRGCFQVSLLFDCCFSQIAWQCYEHMYFLTCVAPVWKGRSNWLSVYSHTFAFSYMFWIWNPNE